MTAYALALGSLLLVGGRPGGHTRPTSSHVAHQRVMRSRRRPGSGPLVSFLPAPRRNQLPVSGLGWPRVPGLWRWPGPRGPRWYGRNACAWWRAGL